MAQNPTIVTRAWLTAAVAVVVAGAAACAGSGTSTPTPNAQPVRVALDTSPAPSNSGPMSAAFLDAFTTADTRARAITFWLQCVPTIARLRASGTFGPAARAPKAIYCDRTGDGVPIGGVYDIDSAFTSVRRLTTVRLDGARPRYTDILDTARIASEAKLARDVHRTVAAAWAKRARPFSVVPFTTVPVGAMPVTEAWVIPRATKARSYVSGGDVGYTRNADGTLRVLDDRTTTWMQLTLPASGPFRVYSSVRDVAAVSDLVTARFHTELGRAVTVSTPVALSTLVPGLDPATGARVVWKHTPVTP